MKELCYKYELITRHTNGTEHTNMIGPFKTYEEMRNHLARNLVNSISPNWSAYYRIYRGDRLVAQSPELSND